MTTNNKLLEPEFWETATRQDVMEAIKNGASVRACNENGTTPLHRVAMYGKDPELVSLLIKHGADIEARDKGGYTPLLAASELHGVLPEMIEKLLDHGANINACSYRSPFDRVMFFADTNGSLEGSNALKRLREMKGQQNTD